MKILCAGGGSGGHVYPALAILDSLRQACRAQHTGLEALWLGRRRGLSQRLVEAAGVPYRNVASGQIKAVNPLIQGLSLARLAIGTLQALGIVRRFRPDVCLATGGHAAAPGALAAYLLGVPLLFFQLDARPGLTVRWLGRLARTVLVTRAAPRAADRKVQVIGYPVRAALLEAMRDRARARRELMAAVGWSFPDCADAAGAPLPLLVVMGGSQGARSINRAVLGHLPALLPHCCLLHVTGPGEYAASCRFAAARPLAARLRPRLVMTPYLHGEFAPALAAADAAVLRAGASVLGEVPASLTPAVLVPLPRAGGHQRANAQALADQGACLVVEDADLATHLIPALQRLLTQPALRQQLERRLQTLARLDGAQRGAQAILHAVRETG